MSACFKIDAARDLVLLPYSPVYEEDPLEVRCQVYNEGDDGEVTLTLSLDGTALSSETLPVKSHTYGFAKWTLDLRGKAGRHTVSVNGAATDLEVTASRRATLDGGFVMLGPPNDRIACASFRREVKQMTEADWKRYVAELAAIGQSCLIVMAAYQYLSIEEGTIAAHFDSDLYPHSDIAARDPIEVILSEAEKHGMKVLIGIGNPYGFWGTEDCFREIHRRYGAHTSFYGWYLGFELDMQDFDRERAEKFAPLIAEARALCPAKPILMSPFNSPSEAFTDYIIAHDLFDIMMPQDSMSSGLRTLEESRNTHRVLLDACRKTGKHLWANCEAFNFAPAEIDGVTQNVLVPRYKNGGMDGKAGFIQQMEAVRPYVEKILNFMFTGFFCPPGFEPTMGGKAAVKQYEDYVAYQNRLPRP